MRKVKLLAAAVGASLLISAAPNERYAAGQVWEYRTRPGDEGSLLKIQSIEDTKAFGGMGHIYHISVVRFHFSNPHMQPVLPHAPVSKETLDASVVRMSSDDVAFPDATEGIAEWRRAKGGVFTITIAEIVAIMDKQTAQVGQ